MTEAAKVFDISSILNNIKKTAPSEEALIAKQLERENIIREMVKSTIQGDMKAMIISGPAGLGKSHIVHTTLKEYAKGNAMIYSIIKGYILATGLYIKLYENRHPGSVLVLDDADRILADETALNILKAACDTNDVREVSWQTQAILLTEDGEKVPKTFEFEGSVIIITNLDIDSTIENKKSKIATHLSAIVSRAHYIDFGLKSLRDYMIRVKMIAKNSDLFKDQNLTEKEAEEVLQFMESNLSDLREISLRMARHLASMRKTMPNWEAMARITKFKKKR